MSLVFCNYRLNINNLYSFLLLFDRLSFIPPFSLIYSPFRFLELVSWSEVVVLGAEGAGFKWVLNAVE